MCSCEGRREIHEKGHFEFIVRCSKRRIEDEPFRIKQKRKDLIKFVKMLEKNIKLMNDDCSYRYIVEEDGKLLTFKEENGSWRAV